MTSFDAAPYLKRVTRAEKLRQDLARSVHAWMQAEPFDAAAKIADDRLSWRLNLHVHQQPPQDEWRHLFGESVHHLRAALDNMAVGIARHNGIEEDKIKQVTFPISTTSDAWKKDRSRIKRLPEHYRDAIEAIQPFQPASARSPQDNPLITLRDLDNQDKHYFEVDATLTPSSVHHNAVIKFETEEGAAASIPPDTEIFTSPFEDKKPLLVWRTKGRIASVKGSFDLRGSVRVTLPNGRRADPVQELITLCDYTEQVILYCTKHAGAASK